MMTGSPNRATFLQVSEKTIERRPQGQIQARDAQAPRRPAFARLLAGNGGEERADAGGRATPPGGGRWCYRIVPRVEPFLPSIALSGADVPLRDKLFLRQRGRSILRASRIHDPACSGAGSSPASKREGGGFAGGILKNWVADRLPTSRTTARPCGNPSPFTGDPCNSTL